MLFVFVLMGEGGGGQRVGDRLGSYLPPCGAVAVAFVLKVGDGLYHPVVDLGERQSLVRRALDGFGYQVGVGEVPPGVAARWRFPRGCLRCQAAGSQRAWRSRRRVRGERGAAALLAGGGESSVRCRAVAVLVFSRHTRAVDADVRGGDGVLLIVLFLWYDICVMALRLHCVWVRPRQRPSARPGSLLRLKVRVDYYVQVRERSLGHDLLLRGNKFARAGRWKLEDKICRAVKVASHECALPSFVAVPKQWSQEQLTVEINACWAQKCRNEHSIRSNTSYVKPWHCSWGRHLNIFLSMKWSDSPLQHWPSLHRPDMQPDTQQRKLALGSDHHPRGK